MTRVPEQELVELDELADANRPVRTLGGLTAELAIFARLVAAYPQVRAALAHERQQRQNYELELQRLRQELAGLQAQLDKLRTAAFAA